MSSHAPAEVLRSYLVGEGVLGDPEGSSLTWPGYVGFLPDKEDVPDDAASLHDTEGTKDGRLMRGTNILHPGITVLVRARDYDEGWTKAQAIASALEEATGDTEVVGATTYTLRNVSQQGPVIALGLEEGTRRRFLFSINFLATLSEG